MPLATFFFELRAVFKELNHEICPYSFWLDFPVIVCPANSCSRTYYDLLKPIAFSFVGNFSQTLQFILCPVYYLHVVAFWAILTRVQLLLRLASKSSRFLLLWILLPFIFCPAKSCLVGRFEFLFLFRFEFCLRTGEAYSSFLNCFLFLFFRSLVFPRSALFYKSLLYFNCFVCYCSVYCCFRHGGENALLLYVENANAPIDTSLSEDKINKICLWFDNVPLTSLAIIIIMLSYSGVVW